MKQWHPRRTLYQLGLLGCGVGLLVIGGSICWYLVHLKVTDVEQAPIRWSWALWTLGASSTFALGIVACLASIRRLTVTYTVDRNAVTVQWWGGQQTIPLGLLQDDPASNSQPTYRFGAGLADEQVTLATATAHYRLFMQDAAGFQDALQQRRMLGVVQPVAERRIVRWPQWAAFQSDPFIRRAALLALVLNVAGWLLVAGRYQSLPETIVLRFDPLGGTLGPRPRTALLWLPLVGLVLQPIHLAVALWLRSHLLSASQFTVIALAIFELLLGSALLFICLR